MEKDTKVARFIAQRIKDTGKSQRDIAIEAGFDSPNMVTLLKQGKTKLPIAKIGTMAKALETDPVHLLKLSLSTYCPETWEAIEPFLASALTEDELQLVQALRTSVGAPFLSAVSVESKQHFSDFMKSLRAPAHIH
jgi:hypothetical protein